MNHKNIGVQDAQATVFTGNGVSNKKEEKATPMLLLPMAKTVEDVAKLEPKKKKTPKEVAKPEQEAVPQRLSIDELTDKADRIYLLKKKYQEIREKRKQLENFSISHDNDNAQLNLVDASGLTISTSNPISIGKLLTDWMSDLNNHLLRTESDIRAELEK